MKRMVIALVALLAATAVLAGPLATPHDGVPTTMEEAAPAGGAKAFGDPTDWLASALAGADYLVALQADITEDNAGNGAVDQDLEDGGWDWRTTTFEHSAAASPKNLYGVTALGLLNAYQLDPKAEYMVAMQDAADFIVAAGPTEIRTGYDIKFLCEFAALPGIADPTVYQNAALAIWNDRVMGTTGQTATALAEYVRDVRHGQGYDNGIIGWDVSAYALAALALHGAFPAGGYDTAATDIAEVMWQDSFNTNPGYFQPFGANQGYDPTGEDRTFWWYNLGVAGLIRAFEATGTHTAEIPGLVGLILDSQYDDGAISDCYGAPTETNERSWQTTGYAVMALGELATPSAAALVGLRGGATWLAETQDASGGWVYSSSGNHYPEVGAEATIAAVYGWLVGGADISVTIDGPDPASCGLVKRATVGYTPGDATPGIRGFEITFEVTGGVVFDKDDIFEGPALDGVASAQYYEVDNGDGTFTVSCAILGATPGLLVAGDLLYVDLTTDSDGPVELNILSVDLRDPDNVPVFADVSGAGFMVDCTAPAAVGDLTAAPAHQEVVLDWDHDGADVHHFAVFRAVWYDVAPAVSAYPEYDDLAGDVVPTAPADYDAAVASAEWTLISDDPLVTPPFTDGIAPRGVYSYQVFAVDAAGNSPAPAGAPVRATNYWLGDFDGDGDVDIADVTALGNSFGLDDPTEVDDDWDDNAFIDHTQDVGPTDSTSPFGIPTTDNAIQFEDLIIVAMNFGEVAAKNLLDLDTQVQLAWTQIDAGRWALDLVDGQGLRGLHITAPASVTSVQLGDLAQQQDAPVFLRNVGRSMDINLAVLGRSTGFEGTGRLLVVTTDAALSSDDLGIDARDALNNPVEVLFSQTTGAELPQAFELNGNFPNPFNPSTTIQFALPQAESVRLSVYSLDGRLVRTLVDEQREAGHHEVVWDGRDTAGRTVATGTYMYVIDAGRHHQTRKMSLIK